MTKSTSRRPAAAGLCPAGKRGNLELKNSGIITADYADNTDIELK